MEGIHTSYPRMDLEISYVKPSNFSVSYIDCTNLRICVLRIMWPLLNTVN
jgi:hypothetical protein